MERPATGDGGPRGKGKKGKRERRFHGCERASKQASKQS